MSIDETIEGRLETPRDLSELAQISYMDELVATWGRPWGAQSEMGKLRMALLSPPSDNEASPEVKSDPLVYGDVGEFPDLDLMRKQYEDFRQVLLDFGTEIEELHPPQDARGPYGRLRLLWAPASAFVINGGAIIPRYGLAPFRRGFEVLLARKLGEIGCPILYTVHGLGIFELGGNCQWIDPHHLVIGVGPSTNMEAIRQVWPLLKDADVHEIYVTPFHNVVHLDIAFGMADAWLGVIDPRHLERSFLRYLTRMGIELIEVPPEEGDTAACNTLVLEPGVVVLPAGNPVTTRELRSRQVEVIEVDMSEFIKIGGGPHCATSNLIRDPGPLIKP